LLLLALPDRVLLALLLLHATLLFGLLPLLVRLDAALLLVDPTLLGLGALPLGIITRALALGVDAGAIGGEALLLGLLAALLVHHAALLLRLLAARLIVALLPRQHVAPELLVLAAARIPLALVLLRAPFRLAPLHIVEAAVLVRVQILAARLHPVAVQPGV